MKKCKGAGVNNFAARLALATLAVAVIPACGGGGGGGGGVVAPSTGSPFIVAGPTGTRSILVRGGKGTAGPGGNGGSIQTFQDAGSDTNLLRTGSVLTSFAYPAAPVNLGSNPRTISVDTTLQVGSGLTAESTVLVGDDGANPATGLHVLPGVTLKVGPNFDNNASIATKEIWQVNLTHGILIEGTLKGLAKDGQTNTTDFVPVASELVIRAGGKVDLTGADSAPGGDGSNGGWFSYTAGTNRIVVEGVITTAGGSGDNGGLAGGLNLWTIFGTVVITGTIDTSGGQGNDGIGGEGYFQRHQSAVAGGGQLTGGGGCFMSGTLLARGGHGTAGGGLAGWIQIDFDTTGPYVFTGTVDACGGNCLGIGNGGNARIIRIIARGGEGRYAGKFLCKGGNGLGGGNGGNGGEVQLNADTVFYQPVQPGLYIGADIDASGGDGATGGNAGYYISFTNANFQGAFVQPGTSPSYYVGYGAFDASGGNGSTNGGNAGFILLQNAPVVDPGGTPWLGSFRNEVDLFARGGHGTTGNGGNGNYAVINMTLNSPVAPRLDRTLVNTGMFITHGGNGAVNGGNGGQVLLGADFWFAQVYNVTNSGELVSSGGNAGTGTAGNAGPIRISSDADVTNTAALTANGGAASGTAGIGGNGNAIVVEGQRASHTGTISARGGNAPTVVGGPGGDGGRIDIASWNGLTFSTISGTIIVQRGTGLTNGTVGRVFVDGWEAVLSGGQITY